VGQPQVVEIDTTGLVWVKSSASQGAGNECVEIAATHASVLVRNSRDRHGPRLGYPIARWKVLLSQL
jgi:hypothetical protein